MESRAFWFMLINSIVICLGEEETVTIRRCESDLLSLNCSNHNTINVISANYGRTSSLYCPGPNSETRMNCIQDTSLQTVMKACQGEANCSIEASNSVFKDPCHGVYKYLEVNFTCEGVSCNSLNCDETTEVCVNGSTGVYCECAENYVRNEIGICEAISCLNSVGSCNETWERCEDNNPGISCVCSENYFRDSTGECAAITCSNSADSCNRTGERCADKSPGISCVCDDNFLRNSSGVCTAITCSNSAESCKGTGERCLDKSPGISCMCQDNYFRNSSGVCTNITCLNTDHMCDPITQMCEDLNPGTRCVCAEGYTKSIDDYCRPSSTEMTGDEITTETPGNKTECPSEVITIGGISLSFPLAKTGKEVNSVETCNVQLSQNQTLSIATRLCGDVWQEPILQNCFDVEKPEKQLDILLQLRITDANVGELSRSFALLTYQIGDITVQILELIIKYLAKIVSLGSSSFEVTDAVVGIVSIIMQVKEEILDQAEGVPSVIPLMEEQISNVHRNGQNYSQTQPDLDVSALQVPKFALEDDTTFISTYTTETADEELVQETSITVPSSVLPLVEKVYPNTSTVPVSFVTYQDPRLFRMDKNQVLDAQNVTDEYIGSYVISLTVELPNVTISKLPQNSPVIIRFSDVMLRKRENATRLEILCVYWKRTLESGEGEWSQSGCRSLSTGFENVTCSCDHLTSFAVLVRTYDEEGSDFHLALQLITVIGCIISVIGLSLSLICMIFLRTVRVKQQTHVHFNVCLALLGLYLSFLFGIGQADQPEMCRRMTSVIYFFCLSSMAWMSVEAFYIYKLIWKCKQHNIKHLIPVGIVFAWVMPGIAAVVIYFLDDTHDYDTERDYCFLHPGHVLLYGFLLELFILFLYNSIVFVLVSYRISCRKITVWNKEDRRQELSIRLKSTLLFWLLLGISWIFGFLATFEYPASIVFQIIFCALLSLQGFLMFYMLIVQNPEMKNSLSSVSTLRIQSTSLQLGTRSSAAIYTKKPPQQELASSVDQINDHKTYV
ncbi:Adhesion G-protein coupled receptor G6 [Holothuria leucospilota]|uniref:Adhesion G-protein coupled receptor G6 n=1 Tax=Holothuria leucospilota TaxID=206669 RepID=A0A9Q1CE32_HOLLE|nr:Adhesion G-protein coupled receptor G6 [Holothuria leucospilota]